MNLYLINYIKNTLQTESVNFDVLLLKYSKLLLSSCFPKSVAEFFSDFQAICKKAQFIPVFCGLRFPCQLLAELRFQSVLREPTER